MRTAQQIEEIKAQKDVPSSGPPGKKETKNQIARRIRANAVQSKCSKSEYTIPHNPGGKWPKGFCPNPGGRPKHDLAAILARDVVESSYSNAKRGLMRALSKGNAYTFKELAERGYGKLTERQEVTLKDNTDSSLDERIAQLERDLGLAKQIDESAGDLQLIGRQAALPAPSDESK